MEQRTAIPPGLPRSNPTVSYWQDPPHPLSSTRTTEALPESADYVIVGSGISGALIAFNILERSPDAKIVMLEARGACSGATGRNGGHTKAASYRTFPSHTQTHSVAEAVRIARLEHANIRATHAFAAKHGIACESRPCDTFDVVYDRQTWDEGVAAIAALKQSFRSAQSAGEEDPVARYGVLDAEEARRETYCAGEDVIGAFRYEAGSISAYKFTMEVLDMCLRKGLNLQTHTPVNAISSSSLGGNSDRGAEKSTLWTATTARGTVTTQNLILATNGYTAHLLPEVQGRIVPLRGQITAQRPGMKLVELTAPKGLPTTYSFNYAGGYEYMIPRPQMAGVPEADVGDIIIGGGLGRLPQGGLSEFGETDDTIINSANSAYLRETLPTYFDKNWGVDGGEERVKRQWTGIMGVTQDGLPFVGEVPDKSGLWISAGFNGHGMVLCLKCAEALTAMIFSGYRTECAWFPESFIVSKERLMAGKFPGTK